MKLPDPHLAVSTSACTRPIPAGYLTVEQIAQRSGWPAEMLHKKFLRLWSEQGVAVKRGEQWYVDPIVIPAIEKDRRPQVRRT